MPVPNNPQKKKSAGRRTDPAEIAREQAMKSESSRSAEGRHKNIMAGTADARMRGYAIGAQRAGQAKRDKKPRGEQRKNARSK